MSFPNADSLNKQYDEAEWPRFDSVVVNGRQAQCSIYINSNLSYFEGHFPEQSVVPGVVQVHWVGELAQKLFACEGFNKLKKIKFSNVILPSSSLILSLDYRLQTGDISFEYKDANQCYSSGLISFSIESNKA